MEPVTIRIPDDTHSTLSAEADERDASMSEVGREYIEKGMAYDELKRETDRLRAEKRALINDREERTDLVEYVERERQLDQERQQRRKAPVWRRAKWWILGEPDEDG